MTGMERSSAMKVLIAVEDGTYGKAVVDFVSAHNWPPDTEFKVLTVTEPVLWMAYGAPVAPDVMANMINQSQQYAQDIVADVASQLRKQCPKSDVDDVIVQGSPKDEILIAAKEWPADLIVMGSHGRTGLQRVMLGSVSLAVCANSPCSVMIVRLSKDELKKKKPQAVSSKQTG